MDDDHGFDLNAPFDAPIRARKAREMEEHNRYMKWIRTKKAKLKLAKLVKAAWQQSGKDGGR